MAIVGFNVVLSIILFIFVELPWLNTEKFVVSLMLGSKPKQT